MTVWPKVAALLLVTVCSYGGVISENFDDVTSLAGSGWVVVNNSTAGGSSTWFQGNTGVFNAWSGAASSYVAANFNAAGYGGNISLWLLSPILTFEPGQQLSFWTRTEAGSPFADSLDVRVSTNGSSSDVGSTTASVGDFTSLLGTINPGQSVPGYPEHWTQFTFALPTSGSGRIGLRYFVTDTAVNGNYIGIDSFEASVAPGVPEPATWTGLMLGCAGLLAWKSRRTRASSPRTEVL